MCRDFSYIADSSCNIYRHKSGLKRHSHTSICRSLFGKGTDLNIAATREDKMARLEHHPYYGYAPGPKELFRTENGKVVVHLDENIAPIWWGEAKMRNITKYGEAARKINWLLRDITKKYVGLIITADRAKNRLNIRYDKRPRLARKKTGRYGNVNPNWVAAPPIIRSAKYSREEFRKVCLAICISNRDADLIHKTPADAVFGKLSFKSLEKYL